MLRRGAQRLQGVLQQNVVTATGEELLLAERAVSGAFAGPSNRVGLALLQRSFLHSASGNVLPLNPSVFDRVLSRNGGLVARLFRRAFSTNSPKRGFENFFPRSQAGKAASTPAGKSTASEARKAATEQTGGGGGSGGDKDPNNPNQLQVNVPINLLMLAATLYFMWRSAGGAGEQGAGRTHEISFQEFKTRLLSQGTVSRLEVANNSIVKVYVKPDPALEPMSPAQGVYKYYFQIGSVDSFERKLDDAQREMGMRSADFVPVKYVHEVSILAGLLEIAPTMLLMGVTYWLVSRQMRQMTGGMGGMGGFGGFGKGKDKKQGGFFGMVRANTSTLDKAAKEKVMFKDVAGCDEAKVEIMEFVDFLKNPNKYKDLGAKIPKGALLVGPPGTGKTLLAKATAGEAGVPFLSISGSDFMEMFVGVGPARVRDLFAQARTQSPSMIFIDEIDAIGRARGRGGGMGGHDERENTLNQLLVEMDGFATTTGVVVLAGTNRPDILDKALLRPGRFDRTITVDTPDIKGRVQIMKVHLAKLKLAKPVEAYSERLAALTPGMSGADIANVCNEAALVAARENCAAVDMVHFEKAIDRVIGGLEKKNKVISPEERRTVAFHESGHAVVSWFLEHAEPLLKVSIVPRGTGVLGFAQYLPNENLLLTKEQLLDRICAILGGRAAEQVLLGKISTGAVNDLERVTQMAYSQVAVYGMNEKIGLLSYRMDREQFDKPYSNETAHMIDNEVRAFVDTAYKRTLALVEEKRDLITAMSNELLRKEVLNLDDVEGLLGQRPFELHGEMRNIDRLRRPNIHDTPAPEASGSDDKGDSPKPPTPGGGSEDSSNGKGKGGYKWRVNPGESVAT